MKTDEFFKMCDMAADNQDLAIKQKNMSVFGNVENVESSIHCDTPIDDFSDDFSVCEPDFRQVVEPPDDFADDFMDDFIDTADTPAGKDEQQTENVYGSDELNPYGIKSVSISPPDTETGNSTDYDIRAEIVDFMEQHGMECSGTDNIVEPWNVLYNDCLKSESSVIEKYLSVHYGLWFDKQQTMNEALSCGREFIQQLKFNYRMCMPQDIRFISSVWKEDYYDSSIVNEFAISTEILPKLLELMSKKQVDTETLSQYRGDQNVLLCCIRLMIEDKFIYGEFNKAITDGDVLGYTENLLAGGTSKLDCIRHRPDFDRIAGTVSSIESSGGLVHSEALEEFADAFYLEEIIYADAEGRLNTEFAHNYLMDDLKQFSFIAEYYKKGLVDVRNCPDNFMYAKVLTDVDEFGLDIKNFRNLKFSRGIQCLVCSNAASHLSDLDYKKFLAVISIDESGSVIEDLDKSEKLIDGYNTFWFQILAGVLNLRCNIPQDAGDNILYVRVLNGKKRKYYLQLDDYVLNREQFLALTHDSQVMLPFNDSSGVMLCNELARSSIKFILKSDSSITTWAKGLVDQNTLNQFSEHGTIMHANFLKALKAANVKVSAENEEKNRDVKIHSSVLEFLKMDSSEYYRYDKMFGYISEHQEFLGLFTSVYAFTLLKLFSSACAYDSVPKVMFMFLYIVLLKFHKNRFQVVPDGFKDLDPNKSVLIVDGTKIGSPCLNYRTVTSSIDNFIDISSNFDRIALSVSEKTIFLKLK